MLPSSSENQVQSLWSDPFRAAESRFNQLVEHLRRGLGNGEDEGLSAYPVDIQEDSEKIYIEAEMPGFKHDDLEVSLSDNVLTIQGERKASERKATEHLRERRFTRIRRSFRLPSSVDPELIDASLEDGVLHITLQKRPDSQSRRIEVKHNDPGSDRPGESNPPGPNPGIT